MLNGARPTLLVVEDEEVIGLSLQASFWRPLTGSTAALTSRTGGASCIRPARRARTWIVCIRSEYASHSTGDVTSEPASSQAASRRPGVQASVIR